MSDIDPRRECLWCPAKGASTAPCSNPSGHFWSTGRTEKIETLTRCPRCHRVDCLRFRAEIASRGVRIPHPIGSTFACSKIQAVVELSRFDSRHGKHLEVEGRVLSLPNLSIRMLALFRAYIQTIGSEGTLKISDRLTAADEISVELAHALHMDMIGAFGGKNLLEDLNAAIGDLCPGCHKPMTDEDGPALRDDYRCIPCLTSTAGRKEY